MHGTTKDDKTKKEMFVLPRGGATALFAGGGKPVAVGDGGGGVVSLNSVKPELCMHGMQIE